MTPKIFNRINIIIASVNNKYEERKKLDLDSNNLQ